MAGKVYKIVKTYSELSFLSAKLLHLGSCKAKGNLKAVIFN